MLLPCDGCRRHVRSDDARCPFCGATIVARRVVAPDLPRMSRAAVIAAAAAIGACGTPGGSQPVTTAHAPAPASPTASEATTAAPVTPASPAPSTTASSAPPAASSEPPAASSVVAEADPSPPPSSSSGSSVGAAAYGGPPPLDFGSSYGLYGGPPAPTVPAVAPPHVTVQGGLPPEDEKQLRMRATPRVRACAAQAAKANPELQGALVLAAKLMPDGTIVLGKVTATGDAAGLFEACVKARLASLKLPARAAAIDAVIRVKVTPP